MRKLNVILGIILLVGIVSFLYMSFNQTKKEYEEIKEIDDYIIETSIIDEPIKEETKKKSNNNNILYQAVLEIPKINLKKGLVDATNGFRSINYAISIDPSSNYPLDMGNFILYAHSGSSYISFFNKLYMIELNDNIYVYYNGTKYSYKVIEKYLIDKTGKANVLKSNDSKYITLITCSQQVKGKQIIIIGTITNEELY